MARVKLSTQMAELSQRLKIAKGVQDDLYAKIRTLEDRNKVIAAENESLNQDKKWLKLLVQNFTEILSKSSIKER